jgi:hypothetical protein
MDNNFDDIVRRIRKLAVEGELREYTYDEICKKLPIRKEDLQKYVSKEEELIAKILEKERESFKIIFDEHDFEGVNAIDILLTVSKEVSRKFPEVSPSVTMKVKEMFPKIYQDHIDKRIDFIFEKIQINIQKGINQGMYRDDLSIELVARLYISRLIDMHNPDLFPPSKFSFETLFDFMFENFVRSIAKPEGLAYYKKKIRAVRFENDPG